MQKNYFKILALAFLAFSIEANAQCTGCTTTISGADANNYIVASGQTFCITATGSMSGLITVNAGGTVCNQGTISSPYFWVNGGTLKNYGTVNVSNLLVSTAGDYLNYGNSTHDSILITDASSTFYNDGIMTTIRLGNSTGAVITNNFGSITADYVGDSVATFNNNANGQLKINYDLYNAYNSGFYNVGYLDIDRDFLNSTGATFVTSCMVAVGRDWYNTATILSATSTCGGFNIVGGSFNSGSIGTVSNAVDICDAGNPPLGLDGPGGTISSTTTYCTCANVCVWLMPGINDPISQSSVLIQNVYPNPTSSSLTIEIQNKQSEGLVVEVMDMVGRKHSSITINSIAGLTTSTLDVSKLAQGMYILSITDSKKLQSKQLFSVVK